MDLCYLKIIIICIHVDIIINIIKTFIWNIIKIWKLKNSNVKRSLKNNIKCLKIFIT